MTCNVRNGRGLVDKVYFGPRFCNVVRDRQIFSQVTDVGSQVVSAGVCREISVGMYFRSEFAYYYRVSGQSII